MARRKSVQGLSPFSWEKEAGLSAARQRLLGPTEATPPRSQGRRTVWRVLGWSLTLAVIAAAIFGAVALKLRWPGMRFYRGLFTALRGNLPLCGGGAMRLPQPSGSSTCYTCVITGPLEITNESGLFAHPLSNSELMDQESLDE